MAAKMHWITLFIIFLNGLSQDSLKGSVEAQDSTNVQNILINSLHQHFVSNDDIEDEWSLNELEAFLSDLGLNTNSSSQDASVHCIYKTNITQQSSNNNTISYLDCDKGEVQELSVDELHTKVISKQTNVMKMKYCCC